jgi:hypothetical protein
MLGDPYETGTPKYKSASDIYDALCALTETDEMNILQEIGCDVSYEQQGYYYTDKGNELKEKFENLSDYGDKMWLMDLAVLQLDGDEIHDTVYEALCNSDLAKRIGFKKLFVDVLLRGDAAIYNRASEEFELELGELDRFDYHANMRAFTRTMNNINEPLLVQPYGIFANRLCEKVNKLQLLEESRTIAESRAHLSCYDDFIFGLRANQELYRRQEQSYQERISQMHGNYQELIKQILLIAENKELLGEFNGAKINAERYCDILEGEYVEVCDGVSFESV